MKTYFTKILLVAVISVFSVAASQAQYRTAVGGHVAKFCIGMDVKHFFDAEKTVGLEVFGGMTQEANDGYFGRVLCLKQFTYRNSRFQFPLKMMFGVGAHGGYYRDPLYTIVDDHIVYYPMNTFSAGIDGMFGLEWNSRKLPFTIGGDVIPYYALLNPGVEWIDFGINVRWILPD